MDEQDTEPQQSEAATGTTSEALTFAGRFGDESATGHHQHSHGWSDLCTL